MIFAVVIAIEAIANQPEKFRVFSGIRTHDLCVRAVVLYQLS